MREKKAKLRGSPGNGEKTPVMAYGCLFCITGREERVAEQIRSVCPEVQTTTMRQLKYRTHNGEKCLEAVSYTHLDVYKRQARPRE